MKKLFKNHFIKRIFALAIILVASIGMFKLVSVNNSVYAAVIGTNAKDKYAQTGYSQSYSSTITQCKSSASGTTTTKWGQYSWSGASTADSRFGVAGNSTFTFTASGFSNPERVIYGRVFVGPTTNACSFTFTVQFGNKSDSISGNTSTSSSVEWFPDIKGGGGNSVTYTIKNNSGSPLAFSSGYMEVMYGREFTVKFDYNGCSGGVSSTTLVYYSSYSSIKVPTRSGYKFLGYYDAKTGGTKYYNADGTPTKTIWDKKAESFDKAVQLYAQWEVAAQAVNISAGTGVSQVYLSTNQNAASGSVSGTKFNSGTTVYGFAKLAKGYNANSSWTIISGNQNTEGAIYRVGSKTVGTTTVDFGKQNATLATYTITYKDMGGGNFTGTHESGYPTQHTYGTATALKKATRAGYDFGGWYTNSNCTGNAISSLNATAYGSNIVLYAKWNYVPVIQEVVDKINIIGGQTNVAYPQSKASIEAAEAAYKALIEEYPEYASVISDKYLELQNDRTKYEDTKESLVNDAIAKINAIGDVKYTNTSKGLIDSADLAYAKLTDEDKALVTNSLILAQANTDYDSVDLVFNNENAISFEYSDTAKDAIDIARSGYNDLSEYQKSIYPQESLNELVEYENAYTAMDKINNITMKNSNECKQSIVDARNTIDQLTEAEMALVNTSFIESLENDEMAFDVIETINDINKPKYTKESKALIDNARDAYENLTEEQKALVVNYTTLTKDEEDYQRVDEVAKEINEIGHIRYDDNSNNKIKDARESYKSLSKDQKAFFPSAEQESLQNYEESYKVLEKIYSIGNVEYNNKSQKLIDDARKAYDSLTDEQKALIDSDDFNVLVTSEDDFSSKDSNVKWLFIVILIICYAVIALAGIIRIIVAHKRNKDDENDNDNYNVRITIY